MSIVIAQSAYAVGPSMTAFFVASGGTAPYAYSVQSGGAGGTINPLTGVYTSPAALSSDPTQFFDTIIASDQNNVSASVAIQIGNPLQLVMEALQRVMALASDRVYLYNQKILQPADSDLYIAVRVEDSNSFGNVNQPTVNGDALDSRQSVHMIDTISFDLISRNTSALRRRGEFLRVWNSDYFQRQQAACGFLMGRDPVRPFLMVPDLDGAAIPYRFRVHYHLQYTDVFQAPTQYFDTFFAPDITTNP